ncbi:MAG: hypothetical protein V2I27_08345 [Erythrobacter sp.]|jgi:hypothetical protein|nr:hypothetical protein [Erythrobacter sp.]
MPFTLILPAVTFGIVGALGFSQYRRMKRKPHTENHPGTNAALALQRMDEDRKNSNAVTNEPVSERPPRNERGARSHIN